MKTNNFYNILFYYKTFIIRSKLLIIFFLIIIDLNYIKVRLTKDYNNSKYHNNNGFTNLKKNKVKYSFKCKYKCLVQR